jgi:hypothetical protein
MTGTFSYIASLNGDVSSWGISGAADVYGWSGYATLFDSEASLWDGAGATVINDRHYMFHCVVR